MKKIIRSILLLAVLLASCAKDRNHPGYTYYPDMAYSRAYESWSENPLSEDGRAMLNPVKGTVPRERIPYFLDKNKNDRTSAGSIFTMDSPMKNDTIPGKAMFELICMQCHGMFGDGKGKLFTSGWYSYPPASLLSEKMKTVPDGEIYHVITVGYNLMGAHGSLLTPPERWSVVSYVRKLQGTGK
ncbi:MAG: cytochrome c [Bacteroidetes bacterium]|nr:cytochrome c [Bacteroidota bacterium]